MSGAETLQFAVVIPAYNESATIRDVAVRAWRQVPRVIVVDDGSEDGTAAVMEDLPVTVLRHPRNRGKASSLWRGMELALQEGATAVITLDGDGQHAPEEIPWLIAMHRRYPRSIVVGSRLHDKHKIPRVRYYANRMANFWIAWAAGHHIPDSQSGFRLYPAEVLRSIPVAHDPAAGFVFESEILIEAGRRGMRSMAVPVTVIYGRHLRASHFRQGADIARIARMVAWKLLSRGLDLPGLIRSFRDPERVEPSHESRAGFRS